MKRKILNLIILIAVTVAANAQRDVRADRIIADKRFILRGANVDTIKTDTINTASRIVNANKTILSAGATYKLIAGTGTTLGQAFIRENILTGSGQKYRATLPSFNTFGNPVFYNIQSQYPRAAAQDSVPTFAIDSFRNIILTAYRKGVNSTNSHSTRGLNLLNNGVGMPFNGLTELYARDYYKTIFADSFALNTAVQIDPYSVSMTLKNYYSYEPAHSQDSVWVSLYRDSLGIQTGQVWLRSFNGKGIQYRGNYGSSFGTRSLVDKGYVDSLIYHAVFRDVPYLWPANQADSAGLFLRNDGFGNLTWALPVGGGGGGGLSNGDYGDITVTSGGTVMTIDPLAVTDSKINDVAWSKITSKPTTLSGYGITDALSSSSSSIQNGYFGEINLKDEISPSHYMNFRVNENLTGSRIFSFVTGDANRTLTMAGDATISGTNSGDQTITLTGDVTGSGTGSFAATIPNNTVTLAKMADMATASFLGRNTASTGDPEVLSIATTKSMLNLTGTNSGDQTITLTGDVTGSGTGSFAATVANDAITYGKLQNISATNRLLGRITSGAGDAEELTGTQVTTLLDNFTTSLKGLVPASGGGTTNFLRADGTWAAPPGGGGGGVTAIGTINSQTKSANGAVISGSNLVMQTVDASFPGLMTSAQKSRLDSNFYIVTPTTNTKIAIQKSVDTLLIKNLKDSTDIGFKYTDSTITAYQKLQYGHWILACSDETTAITTGTAKLTFRTPFAVTVTGVRASVNTVSTSGNPGFDIKEGGTTIFSTGLTIDANEKSSTTAATPAVISDTALADDAEITVDFGTAGTGTKGVKLIIYWTRTLP